MSTVPITRSIGHVRLARMAALLLALCAFLACLTPASRAAPPSLEFVSATKALKPETDEVALTDHQTRTVEGPAQLLRASG